MSGRSLHRTQLKNRSRRSLKSVANRLGLASHKQPATESTGNDGLTTAERDASRKAFLEGAGCRDLPASTLTRADLMLEKLQGTDHAWTFPKGHRRAPA